MCGRFALYASASDLRQRFALDQLDVRYTPRYNVAPGSPILAVRSGGAGREGALLHWGLIPHWAKEAHRSRYHTINARLETVEQKPSYRNSWHTRRCLIPANGFYEWQQRATGGKQPWYIEIQDAVLALAGLWDSWGQGSAVIASCTILVHEAPPSLAAIHDRAPVVVPEASWSAWLDPALQDHADIMALLQEQPTGWVCRTVGLQVNKTGNEGPGLLQEMTPQHR
jgi:putative SOS response-associated peptidase YedK